MKAIPKVNTDGLYLEVTLTDDAFFGVVPFYADLPAPEYLPETDTEAEEDPEEQEPEIAGYIVGVPVSPGLYLPRFDLAAWEADSSGDPADYWSEGLTAEEIERITQPQEVITTERVLAAESVKREPEALELKQQNTALGKQVVEQDLIIRNLSTQYEALGKSLVSLELKVLELANKGGGEVGV